MTNPTIIGSLELMTWNTIRIIFDHFVPMSSWKFLSDTVSSFGEIQCWKHIEVLGQQGVVYTFQDIRSAAMAFQTLSQMRTVEGVGITVEYIDENKGLVKPYDGKILASLCVPAHHTNIAYDNLIQPNFSPLALDSQPIPGFQILKSSLLADFGPGDFEDHLKNGYLDMNHDQFARFSTNYPPSKPNTWNKNKNEGYNNYKLDIVTKASVSKNNIVDLRRIAKGLDTRTTLMLRNIPNKVDQQMLKEYLDVTNKFTYDFLCE